MNAEKTLVSTLTGTVNIGEVREVPRGESTADKPYWEGHLRQVKPTRSSHWTLFCNNEHIGQDVSPSCKDLQRMSERLRIAACGTLRYIFLLPATCTLLLAIYG